MVKNMVSTMSAGGLVAKLNKAMNYARKKRTPNGLRYALRA